jgi:hypothetical protein
MAQDSLSKASADTLDSTTNNTSVDCHDPNLMFLKVFAFSLKPYMYPASIEFSITCATIFLIMWHKIGKKDKKYSLPPTKKNFEGVGAVNMPNLNLYLMLDCSRTSKGLFFGIIVFVGTLLVFYMEKCVADTVNPFFVNIVHCLGTLLSSILFIVYNAKKETKNEATLLSEASEIILLLIALVITWHAFILVRKSYQKVIPQFNAFDIVLEIFSLFGVYAFSINSLIALVYGFFEEYSYFDLEYFEDYINHLGSGHSSIYSASPHSKGKDTIELANEILAAFASCLSIIQGIILQLFAQTIFKMFNFSNQIFFVKALFRHYLFWNVLDDMQPKINLLWSNRRAN